MLELNKLYCMDCIEGMKQFPDKYFELAVCDPPYGGGIFEAGGGIDKWASRKRSRFRWAI